jgi:hypothetical protein
MEDYTKTLLLLERSDFTLHQRVQLLELMLLNIEIDTLQGMAKSENKSYNGIKKSNCYYKLNIGCQTMAIKGLTNTNLPF